ncbi:hypothetical protein ACFLXY_08540 [Chloroflexota bacterium]
MDTVKWRPEGWFAPAMLERLYVDVGVKPTYVEVYEAGADAMLERLRGLSEEEREKVIASLSDEEAAALLDD